MPFVALFANDDRKAEQSLLLAFRPCASQKPYRFLPLFEALLDRSGKDQNVIAKAFGFTRSEDFENWVLGVSTLAYALQNIAPAEAGNGPNPEYPWPHEAPDHCPVEHQFNLWRELRDTGRGRKLMTSIDHAIQHFDRYA